jgi:aryl sulfotransferase
MATTAVDWPVKSRDIHNHHMNSTVWDKFKFRDGDIVIATYGKSGTTWMQQIVAQLIFNGAEDVDVHHLSPWVDMRILPPEVIAGLEQQTHRRFVKTHLPVDALVYSPKASYLYIGRDGRDTAWSLYNHYASLLDEFRERYNTTPGLVGPPLPPAPATVMEFYRTWFDENGKPFWSLWENARSWWAIRDLPNVKLVHFSDMKRDLPGAIRDIAAFLGIAIDEATFPNVVAHCSFDYMKANAEQIAPRGGAAWKGGAQTFINKGTNGRWRDVLSVDDVKAYEAKARAELGEECARWLADGKSASA